jgi:deoxyribodipyrimidine photo-lyase
MAGDSIHSRRITNLNERDPNLRGEFVLYWMQQSQRADRNHALEYAIQRANELDQPLLVAFGLMDDYPEANARHDAFMLDGLADVARTLGERGIGFVLQRGGPDDVAIRIGKQASIVVCDCGYLRLQKAWRKNVAQSLKCQVVQVEGDVVVPVEHASDKPEFAARTLRPKITRLLDEYLVDLKPTKPKHDSIRLAKDSIDISTEKKCALLLDALKLDRRVAPVPQLFRGGTSQAKRVLREFLNHRYETYAQNRNQPQTDDVSYMSMYLHFGQISPVWLALQIRAAKTGDAENRNSYIEELIVRRELAMNHAHFTEDYDSYASLPAWAKASLKVHKADRREYIYTAQQLEDAQTHDPYWNAAMREMRHTGYMHNYMRMYWGKKILEWTNTPQFAFRTALTLNNKYFIDGRDANSFTGVGWVFGLHDRPWTQREVFGTVRYMNDRGLKRKCDPDAYVAKVNARVREVGGPDADGPPSQGTLW